MFFGDHAVERIPSTLRGLYIGVPIGMVGIMSQHSR